MNLAQADAFAAMWTALASVLGTSSPPEETISAWRAPELLATWPSVDPVTGTRAEQAERAIVALRACDEDYEAIASDQFRLIRGPGKLDAAPWESVHRSASGLLFQESTMGVRAFYGRFGLEAPNLGIEPDDHISLELGFCAELLVRALNAGGQRGPDECQEFLDAHDEFCRDHLLVWAPGFFERLTEAAHTNFYRGIGLLGQDAMVRLREVLGE